MVDTNLFCQFNDIKALVSFHSTLHRMNGVGGGADDFVVVVALAWGCIGAQFHKLDDLIHFFWEKDFFPKDLSTVSKIADIECPWVMLVTNPWMFFFSMARLVPKSWTLSWDRLIFDGNFQGWNGTRWLCLLKKIEDQLFLLVCGGTSKTNSTFIFHHSLLCCDTPLFSMRLSFAKYYFFFSYYCKSKVRRCLHLAAFYILSSLTSYWRRQPQLASK